MSAEPGVPSVDLPRVEAAQFQFYDHTVGAYLVTADAGIARWIDELCAAPPAAVAADIETRGLDVNKFSITCVTVAFHLGGDVVALLLDPLRRDEHRRMLLRVFDHAAQIVFHGASFDVAPLYAHRLLTRQHIRKIGDTLVASRMVNTYAKAGRSLEELATAYQVMNDDRTTMSEVFAARGLKKDEGWWSTDIDTPTYAVGAMSDTVATLRLWGVPGTAGEGVMARAARYLTTSQLGIGGSGVLHAADAEQVVEDVQQVNRIVLERTARGYAIDAEFPERFLAETGEDTAAAARKLADAGIRPGNGKDLVLVLEERGELPQPWPRTATGQLKADKAALGVFTDDDAVLHSELALAHRTVATSEKVLGYVNKVVDNSGPTGRLHPEIKILGASATGRMSASKPEIQQFPKEARGVIVADGCDWVSADWKSIEPVVLATASGDRQFLADMRAGKDPYEPVGVMAGIDRKLAKRKMLADMYGQGHAAAALQYGWTLDRAKEVAWAIRDGLPILYQLIEALKNQSKTTGRVTTLSGRVVNQDFAFNDGGVLVRDVAQRIAPNHFCQGTALDIMHYSILELDRRGLSDQVHLWMHDEIVADASIAEELNEVMATPPPFLQAVADFHRMEAFLAVDLNEMGQRWEYV
ncbi:DNA polymerase [Mycolicibacterium sp.]|uniref:DNA polymerase n=1 Tax=Mycolicibacterium sp. TaxID=2320850 RepID=UPI00355EE378